MAEKVLLSMVIPVDLERGIEDLLLSLPTMVDGFTSSVADGHGREVELVDLHDMITGHARRSLIRIIGTTENMRLVLDEVKAQLPHANIYYWLVPIIESGKL